MIRTIGLGGGCFWCTEAVFKSLNGVNNVTQGWIGSVSPFNVPSEAVLVDYDSQIMELNDLIEIHLSTHNSQSNHSMRTKYRSGIYYFDDGQKKEIEQALNTFSVQFENKLVTRALPMIEFIENKEEYQHYYYNNPDKPFCQTYIKPKIDLLYEKYKDKIKVA